MSQKNNVIDLSASIRMVRPDKIYFGVLRLNGTLKSDVTDITLTGICRLLGIDEGAGTFYLGESPSFYGGDDGLRNFSYRGISADAFRDYEDQYFTFGTNAHRINKPLWIPINVLGIGGPQKKAVELLGEVAGDKLSSWISELRVIKYDKDKAKLGAAYKGFPAILKERAEEIGEYFRYDTIKAKNSEGKILILPELRRVTEGQSDLPRLVNKYFVKKAAHPK